MKPIRQNILDVLMIGVMLDRGIHKEIDFHVASKDDFPPEVR
jgi:hypothetical protein